MTDNILGVSALGSTGSVSNYSKLLENSSDGSNADFATILKNAIAGSIDNTQFTHCTSLNRLRLILHWEMRIILMSWE